jgi:hypothetical protein
VESQELLLGTPAPPTVPSNAQGTPILMVSPAAVAACVISCMYGSALAT